MAMENKTESEAVDLNPALRSTDDICRDIENLDLDMIKFKLTDPRDAFNWPKEHADEMEKEYKRFLILKVKYPEQGIVPCVAVDTFWHQHILDTQKYVEDCFRIFGFYVHHYPYFGMMGENDEKQFHETLDSSHSLYEREFGEVPWELRQSMSQSATQENEIGQ